MSTPAPALVSIIMPAYNAARYIGESIESVQAQTYLSWELLVVDDGSTDATGRIVQDYSRRDQRVRYIYQQNARQGRARNNGLAQAAGAYIAFLDADDLWLPNKLQVQVDFLTENKADLVFSDTYLFEHTAELNAQSAKMHTPVGVFAGAPGLELFLEHNRIPILTVLCQRRVLEAVGGFVETRAVQNAEDYHLWLKMLLQGYQLWGMDHTLAAYRVHTASVSGTDRQGLRQVVEAKLDLKASYPAYAAQLAASMKQTIIHSLMYLAPLSQEEFFATLDRLLQVGDKPALRPLFKLFKLANARALALRSAYFAFNHLS